jgi:hypothetical protein
MFRYNPEMFEPLYASELGQRIWAFITLPVTVARLETASQLSKPAVEGIAEQLLDEFREDILADRVKQMVGHMVRQIMEQQGWILDQTNVKINSVPFRKAARYRRQNGLTFHVFRSTSDPRDVAITDRRQNAPLPTDTHWIYHATLDSPLKADVGFNIRDISQLRQQVHSHGYQRVRIEHMLRRD